MTERFYGAGSGSLGQHLGALPEDIARALGDTVESLRTALEQRGGAKPVQGDVRAAILRLLAEEPMHGYQIISEIEQRSSGAWKPSPGRVYPILQLLVDEDLTVADEADGKKRYSLTEAGKVAAESADDAPWATPSARDASGATLLPKAGAKLAQATVQVVRNGSPAQVQDAVDVLDDARRKIYAILARE